MGMMIKNQNFGVEIELTGITRKTAADTIAKYFNTTSSYAGTYYQRYTALDRKGRVWQAMSDGSINTQRKKNGAIIAAPAEYSCEIVTPILQYEDIEDLQNIIRELVKAGAFANQSCGIHVHVDGANHNTESLTRLLNFATGRQDLFYEALQIGSRADRWCHKISPDMLKALKKNDDKTKHGMEKIWYSSVNDGYTGSIDHTHYNRTRYHGINLHAYFSKGTVEFRLFNGTTHAGKIKAYVQFCLAMSAWAIETESTNLHFKNCSNYTQEQKANLMKRVLVNRLGLRGAEFKTCRLHLTSAFKSESTTTAA